MSTVMSAPAKWFGLLIAAVIAAIAFGLGLWQNVPVQQVIFYTAATFALVIWVWNNYFAQPLELARARAGSEAKAGEGKPGRTPLHGIAANNRSLLIGLAILLGGFVIAWASSDRFFSGWSVISLLVLAALLVFATKVSRQFVDNRSAFIGITVLVGLFAIGSFYIDGFFSTTNVKSMLVFAAFLGLACVGQTLVAMLGGLDLSIPFVIGSSNVALLYLIGLGVPSWIAVIIMLVLGILIGLLNGFLTYRLQGQALILTLGVGFAISGFTQIITSIGTAFAGNVFGTVPDWLKNLAAMNGVTFGLTVPPVIFIWLIVALILIIGMKTTVYGRNLYALGGNRTSAKRIPIIERRYWWGAFMISGFFSTLTGSLLLGWSGGGFIGVGQPYLFMTLAAVVIGGTSLLGGFGGYGFTVIGVLVLQVLTSFLVGIGLKFEWQQFIFGLLIVPMVALYARSPHIRTQI